MKAKKQLRPHQISALTAVVHGLANADRGKLIMACGTGKTFTSLKIAETLKLSNRLADRRRRLCKSSFRAIVALLCRWS
ncbi:DEAD/DEAH box helicase family protein [Burkholderia ubonensis]|uniref:DEAD/DEAH box helicase family protein n=1 Tax=Burkholderia ubonensis TaxID=101571 RepID=UPI002109100D|nr:DEAD/DEAH box helicase family protein [Burkholderia ubonensis]